MSYYDCRWNPSISVNQVKADLVGRELTSYSEPLFFNAGEPYFVRVTNQSPNELVVALWSMIAGQATGKLIFSKFVESGETFNFNKVVEEDANLVLNLSCMAVSDPRQCHAKGTLSKVGLYVPPAGRARR